MDTLAVFFKDCKRCYCKLSRAEERTLIASYLSGDISAMKSLVAGNLPWIVQMSVRFRGRLNCEDAIQEGVLGFMRAVERFDLGRTTGLRTYAGYWIRQRVEIAKSKDSVICVPRYHQTAYSPLPCPNANHALAAKRALETLSLKSAPEGSIVESVVESDHNGHELDIVHRAMDVLSDRENEMFLLANRDGMTMRAIGKLYGLSPQRVSQINARSLRKIREVLGVCT